MKNLTSKIQWRSGVIALSTLALISMASSSISQAATPDGSPSMFGKSNANKSTRPDPYTLLPRANPADQARPSPR